MSPTSKTLNIELITKSNLFDETYYKNHNAGSEFENAVEDYLCKGSFKGVNPSFLFHSRYYLSKNTDVNAANVCPLIHYIKCGEKEGRAPSVFVDLDHLKQQIPKDVELTYLAYFYDNEIELELSVHPYFDTKYYLENNLDVRNAGISPYHHFIGKGVYEGRNPRADINIIKYIEENNIDTLKEHPFRHFILFSGHPLELGSFTIEEQSVIEQAENEINYIQTTTLEKQEIPNYIIDAIHQSEIFDVNYYLSFAGDIQPYDNAIEHYVAVGHEKLLDPSPYFSTKYYLATNNDIRMSGDNSLYHYVSAGEKEGRQPNPHFNPHDYLELNPDLVCIGGRSLLGHYYHCGISEKRSFIKTNGNNSGISVIHPVLDVRNKDEQKKVTFDAAFYLQIYDDVREAGVEPESHYYNVGEKEGRKPNQYFDPSFYYRVNPDIRTAALSAFEHYATQGYYEGRKGLASKNDERSKVIKPLLFVGHDGIQAGSEVVLLEVVKWFFEHTPRRLKVLLLAPGPVANQYAQYADILVLPENEVDSPELVTEFIKENFEFVYLNTVVSGKLFDILDEYKIQLKGSIITHIHEMEKVIAENLTSFESLKKYSEHIISASPATTKTLIETHNLPETMITTVPAFIKIVDPTLSNLEKLKNKIRSELSIPSDALVVAGCGTVYWRKGPDIFLASAREAIAEKSDIHFVWIGPGPDLEEISRSLTESEKRNIHFIGQRDDANEAIAAADIFYMSSREDPFPLVVMEAAQHCIPTICFSEATGITEFVKDDAGVCLEKIDSSDAAKTILNLHSERDLLAQMGSVARERVTANYTSEKQCLNIYKVLQKHTHYKPSVSVIIPMYNHELFIDERIQTVLNQTIKDIEVLVFDDCSKDNSVKNASAYTHDFRVSVQENIKNTGSPFAQWSKGLAVAKSDVVWIAEGDDTCDKNFISTLLPYFDDELVNIASGKTVIMNEKGEVNHSALEPYLNSAYPCKYLNSFIMDGFEEVNESFGAVCTLVNASGLLLRKSSLDTEILKQASSFKMCGDWLIYLASLRKGKLAYDVNTNNYFRRHSASVVNKVEGSNTYFYERYKVTEFVFDNYKVTPKLVRKAFSAIDREWERFKYKHKNKTLDDLYDKKCLKDKITYQNQSKHIGLYVHGMLFSKGGIERLAADLANYFVEQGYGVTIYARHWGGNAKPVYPLYGNIKVKGIFDETRQEVSIQELRKALLDDGIDVFIPMLSEWLFTPIVEAANFTGIPVIASEHNDPWKIEDLWWNKEERLKCFEHVDSIHLLLNKFRQSLPSKLHSKVHIIPNGIEFPATFKPYDNRKKIIVAVGRLAEQKRFDRLIQAVAKIKETLLATGWHVEIYGEGYLRSELEQLIDKLGVADLIALKGSTNDIASVLNSASINVMPSEFEGFGIALVEAMARGLPSIAFKQCNGPNEIINSKSGLLVESIEELSDSLAKMIKNDKQRSIMSKNARFASKQFEKKTVFPKWVNMINNVVGD